MNDIIGYKVERYIFGRNKNGLKPPPAKDEMEVHVYCDGGGDSFGAVAFLRWKEGSEYKMKRIYAASKVVSPKSKLSVPRREVCSLVMGTKIGKELSAELEIDPKRVFLHSDSLIAMFWLEKAPGQLNTYVSNRITYLTLAA